jgi:hypothetical protein
MNVPLHRYDAHRRFREDLWRTERLAQQLATQHAAKLQKQQAVQQATVEESSSRVPNRAPRSTVKASVPTQEGTQAQSSSPPAKPAALPSSIPSSVKGKGRASPSQQAEDTKSRPDSQNQVAPPQDRRFAPEKVERPPWYLRLLRYRPSPTGWTADEEYGHRTYIIPRPLHAAMDNLKRSWALVLMPTWKFSKMLAESFTSGRQKEFWLSVWTFTNEGGQSKLVETARAALRQKIAEEEERLDKEKNANRGSSSRGNDEPSSSPSPR